MKNVVLVDSVRTGLTKSFRGTFNMTRGDDMVAHCIDALLDRNPNLPSDAVEDIIMGCGNPEGPTGHNIGRNAVVLSNLPITTGGTTVNRYCSSGLQTISMAAGQIMAGGYDTIMAGGVEQITQVQPVINMNGFVNDKINQDEPGIYFPMGQTAEVVAKRYKVARELQDEYALESQIRTGEAQAAGRYDDEIISMKTQMLLTNKETGEQKIVDAECTKDECNRPETTIEGLSSLKPVFDPENGSVTAGNSSQLSDGASVTLVMSEKKALDLGLKPKAYFRGFTSVGCKPDEMGIGPVFAIPKLLQNYNLSIDDIDLWELNEAFAVVAMAAIEDYNIQYENVNIYGGAVALGHPIGASGARILTTLINGMNRQNVDRGLATLCIGGGEASALIVEKYD